VISTTDLSPEQRSLVDTTGCVFAEACPGAGKTRALVARFIRRVEEEPRRGIALVSFTNAAMDEVRTRCRGRSHALLAPNFVGTFDAFINRYVSGPAFLMWRNQQPRFLESWDRLDSSRVRLPAMDQWLHYELEWFQFDSKQQASLHDERIGGKYGSALRAFAANQRSAVEAEASKRLESLLTKGYLASTTSRWLAHRTLEQPNEQKRYSALLGQRFAEIIVDEGQDCGDEEIAVLELLKAADVAVVMVADLDQAIFEFRRAMPTVVRSFGKKLGDGPRLSGNHRSTPAICAAIASLRSGTETDEAVGANATLKTPIVVLRYAEAAALPNAIRTTAEVEGFAAAEVLVASHQRKDALSAAGRHPDSETGSRKIAILADAAISLRGTAVSPRERKNATESAERVILGLVPSVGLGSTTLDAACEESQISRRWLREAAMRLLIGYDPRDLKSSEYAAKIREHVSALSWPTPQVLVSLADNLKAVPQAGWDALISAPDEQGFVVDTIHGVKGKEFPAVAVVVPKKLRADSEGRTVLDCWEQSIDSEARRVLYVGASRAERLLMLVVHQLHADRVGQLLVADDVPYIAVDASQLN
jgi:DNA helicase II / ATP-dependent DNA helicase PcrA